MSKRNTVNSTIKEISQSELKYVNGGFGWLVPVIIGVATLIVPSTIGKDKNKNDNDPNKY